MTLESGIVNMFRSVFLSLLFVLSFQSFVSAQETKRDSIKDAKHDSVKEVRHDSIRAAKLDTIPGSKGKLDVAPETRQEKKQEKALYSFAQFGRETWLFVKQPLRWKGMDWLKVGVIAGGTALLTLGDAPIRNAAQDPTKSPERNYHILAEGGRIYGEWYSIGALVGGFGIYGLIARDTLAKKMAIELFQAGVYSELVTEILKVVIGRARPYENVGSGTFHPFTLLDVGYNSFPSGHSTSAFALSTVMSRHANSLALKILIYVPAGITLFSRIYQDKHWVSDELIGAAVGFFVGNWVVDLHEAKRHRINVAVTSVYPPAISIDLDRLLTKQRDIPRSNP